MDIGHIYTIMIFVPPKFTLQQRVLRLPAEGRYIKKYREKFFSKKIKIIYQIRNLVMNGRII